MKFDKKAFIKYMNKNCYLDVYTRGLLNSIVDYGEKNCNVTQNQIVYFIYDILKEVVPIDYEEIEQFCK